MKNILLIVHDDAGQEARFQAALDIGRALEGHLTCLDIVRMPVIAGDFGGTATAMLLADEREREGQNRVALEARLKHEDLPWDWIDMTGDLAECATRASGLADIIVCNRGLDSFPQPDMATVAGSIAIRSGKPVVAVADDCPRFDAAGKALIAWDGSEPAMAVTRACVPLLKRAEAVEIFTVDDGSGHGSTEEAATYLSRHGIHASIKRVHGLGRRPDALIAEECAEWGASYCVMGAFGHNRLKETLFGGVTRRMLSDSKVPLILGH